MTDSVLRILIADDHPAFRSGVRAILDSIAGVEVVGEAGTGAQAVSRALELEPDLVLMDLQMPELNGIEATRQIARTQRGIGIIVLTMFEDDEWVFAAMRAGARGYLLKDAQSDEIVRAVHAVADGEALLGPAIAERLIVYFAPTATRSVTVFPNLTDREREVLVLVASGKSNASIASELVLSLKTVRNHVSNIFNKLQVVDRASAIVKAREAGLGVHIAPAC